VGANFGDTQLIDLEFLPGQDGESIVISKTGTVYYVKSDFTPLTTTVSLAVESGGEQGLLNIVADPLYGISNQFIYLYYTVGGIPSVINRVSRFTVDVDVNAGTFALLDEQVIIEFPKGVSSDRHNGGSLVFLNQDDLAIGVGEGTVAANAQSLANGLGKVHRLVPSRTPGVGGFTIPADNPFVGVGGAQESIFALGLRNPFTMVVDQNNGGVFIGDVGSNIFEEINILQRGANFGWPNCEGPCDPFNPSFVDPIHGYADGDTTFNDEDPLPNPQGGKAIFVSAVYQGTQYNGLLTGKLIYNEFFAGWVRLLTTGPMGDVLADQHIGHLEGLTGLHTNPADGLLYGVSLFGSDQIQRLDLTP
jgi:glucose/arabinose dehydrogenase